MSTALSMPSPHSSHGTGAFASSLQLSPAFRSLHAAALRQRQADFERLRELARSDEFSDDESDGDEDEDEDDEDQEDEDQGDEPVCSELHESPRQETHESPRDVASASDSDIDAEETVLLPFLRPVVSRVDERHVSADAVSPKADDWTILDKSPTCEGLVFGRLDVSESWFSQP